MKTKQWKKVGCIISLLVIAVLALGGCKGSDGSAGAQGIQGDQGDQGIQGVPGPTVSLLSDRSPEALRTETFTGAVTNVTIASAPKITFWIKDSAGKYVSGLTTASATSAANLNYLRFAIAKLVPGTSGSQDRWVSYMLASATSFPSSERVAANLVANADGSYTYTFAKDITDSTQTGGVTYEPTLQHRLIIQFNGTVPGTTAKIEKALNIAYDFIPSTGAVVAAADQRNITTKEACNSCHGGLGLTTPHGGRADTKFCVICHNQQLGNGATNVKSTNYAFTTQPQAIADGEVLGDMAILIHKIHNSSNGTQKLVKTGYQYVSTSYQFEKMAYPQEVTNCVRCHTASAAAPQGDNWKNRPSRQACGACHDGIDWATGLGKTVAKATTGHVGGPATSDAMCVICHVPASIQAVYHQVKTAPNSGTNVPTGAAKIEYEIYKVTANASFQPVVTFRILKDGVPVTFNAYTGTTDAAAATYYLTGLLTGFKGSPAFLVAYSTTGGVDWDNRGNNYTYSATAGSASPSGTAARVYIADLVTGKSGTIAASTVSGAPAGSYDAVLTTSNMHNSTTGAIVITVPVTFPTGSKLRTVALQGYFTQTTGVSTTDYPSGLARHAKMVYKAVAGEERRVVVDSAKCATCHENIEGHGGNRVYDATGCAVCHTPDLLDNFNMKDMIHNIHSKQGIPTVAPINVKVDWSGVKYPSPLGYCLACHKTPASATATPTYATVPAGALPSTFSITEALSPAPGVIGNTDTVTSPFTAACISCHSKSYDIAHVKANGGVVLTTRVEYDAAGNVEQCNVCHGAGKSVDPAKVHKGLIEDAVLP